MIDIRPGRPEDFSQLMEQVAQSFREQNPAHPRFEPLYPDVIGSDPERMSHWRLAFIDGNLAAGIEIIPQCLQLGPFTLRSGGIGNVHCWHPYRKTGCMSQLLERCISDMNSLGYAISLLGGDRLRYGNFGWEHAGSQRLLNLSASMVRHDHLPPAPASCDFKTYNGSDDEAQLILKLYRERRLGSQRSTLDMCKAVLNRPNIVTYLYGDQAYLTVNTHRQIAEYAGSPEALELILRFLLKSGSWSVSVPDMQLSGATEQLMLKYASSYSVTTAGMCRINNLTATLNVYQTLLEERLQGWQGRLAMASTDGDCTLLEADGTHVQLQMSASSSSADLTLNRKELARLVFGPFPPALSTTTRVQNALRLCFPLPLFWTPLDHI